MNHNKLIVIILYVISICDIRIISGQTNNSTVHHLHLQRGTLKLKSGKRRFPAPKQDGDVFELFFGVLLPEEPIAIGCTYKEAMPAIELAIQKLQEPGGLFERYTICVDYRDTKPSSHHGTFAAFDLYTHQSQGYIILHRFA